MVKSTVVAVALCLLLSSCASIMHGSKQKISFSSTPSGAKVWVDNIEIGSTPISSKLAREMEHVVKFQLDGYQPKELKLTKSTSGWIWGNILFGGLIGIIIDASNGAMYKLSPEELKVTLSNQGISSIGEGNGLVIVTVLKPNADWEKIGNLSH